MNVNRTAAALFTLSLAVGLISIFLFPVLWWDEGVYADLGRTLADTGSYSFDRWGDWVGSGAYVPGFRPPLLPLLAAGAYALGLPGAIFLIIPFAAAGGTLALWLLVKRIYGQKTATCAALLMAFTPLFVLYSGRLLNDVLATALGTAAFLTFWIGFEEGQNRSKLLCGFFTGVAVLTRYPMLLLPLLFALWLPLRTKSFSFLRDRWLLLSILIFVLTLSPWLLWSNATYGNPFGAFLHGLQSSGYWGGIQPPWFVLEQALPMFSILVFPAVWGMWLAAKKRGPAELLLLIWAVVWLVAMSMLVHKEDRFFLPALPPLAALAALALGKVRWKHAFVLVICLLVVSSGAKLAWQATSSRTQHETCFLDATAWLARTEDNSLILTDNSPVVYFYTHRENHFYPASVAGIKELVDRYYAGRPVYVLWSESENNQAFRQQLMTDNNFGQVWTCSSNQSLAAIWKLNTG